MSQHWGCSLLLLLQHVLLAHAAAATIVRRGAGCRLLLPLDAFQRLLVQVPGLLQEVRVAASWFTQHALAGLLLRVQLRWASQ